MAQLIFNDDGSVRIPDSLKEEVPDLKKLGKIYRGSRGKIGKDVIMTGGKDREFRYEKDEEEEDNSNIWNYGEKYDEKEYNLGEDTSGFNLYANGKKLEPLKFSNGKTQENIVKEIVDAINEGHKVIFIKGVCGTGKCLDKNTFVFCKPIDKKYFGYYKISDILKSNGEIISINDRGDLVKAQFKNVRKTGKKKLYKLKTRTGREIIVSENHPFLTITQNGTEWIPLCNLNINSYICMPNELNLKNISKIDENKLRVLAHLIAEGKLGDKAGSPKYYQNKEQNLEVRKDYELALKSLFPDGELQNSSLNEVTITFRNKNTSQGTTNKLRLLIREFGLDGKKSSDKFIPEIIFNLNRPQISLFLKVLFSCDGSIYYKDKKDSKITPTIEYCSISRRLITGVSLLLTRLGIQHTITSKKFRENKDYAFYIYIRNKGQIRKFIENIGFIGRKQEIALKVLHNCNNPLSTNIDKVPRIIREYLKNKGYSYNELDRFLNYQEIEKLRLDFGFKRIRNSKMAKCPCVFKQSKIDFLRHHLFKINKHIKDNQISFICNNKIFWDKVKSIDFLKEDETYDLEVPEHSNFIADGFIVHNSAIALNLAKILGKASIVVPGKALQKQYAEDYSHNKYVLKDNHKKLKIKIITGRENHACLYERGCSANENNLPCKIEIKEPNMEKLNQYLKECGKNKKDIMIKDIRRISIAPACPYWSPIIPSEFELPIEADKVRYEGLKGINFTIYNRKKGCGYYNQFNSYLDAEAIIFNSAKYKLETLMNRKPATNVEIIDECDEFLDSFSNIRKINLNRFFNALIGISYDNHTINLVLKEIYKHVSDLINDEHIKEIARRNELIPLKETSIASIFSLFLDNPELIDGIDDENYCNEVAEMALEFADLYGESYVSFSTEEKGIYANVATINLAKKFEELLEKNKVLVFMSGTIHEINVLKDVFGAKDFKIIEAETINQGTIEVVKTGIEMDCKYENFASRNITRESYLIALDKCLERAQKPALVHVNSFDDLPSIGEKEFFHLHSLITKEKLLDMQRQDRENKIVQNFKNGETDVLFTTKCNRGVDFPGEQCRSVIFTKYPNPNVNSIFWRMLRRNHPKYYWEFYKDKAKREFLQKIYRGVRSEQDHVYLLSPDTRVLDAVNSLIS